MPRTNKPMTLRDLAGDGNPNEKDESHEKTSKPSSSSSSSNNSVQDKNSSSRHQDAASIGSNNKGNGIKNGGVGGLHKVCHIPTLSNAPQAKALLERVVREFAPIAQERGYNVLSVSELCCCQDGLDFEPGKRKLSKIGDNVLGYNRTMTRGGRNNNNTHKSHTIHIRLRCAQNHNVLLDYEDVAGTLAHELAHCERSPHDAIFFKVMDQLLEEHAMRMAANITITNTSGGTAVSMPSFSGHGQTLGGGGGSSSSKMGRSRLLQPGAFAVGGGGHTLGGEPGRKLGGDAAFTQWMTPTEAAAVAALARRRQQQLRLRGDGCCNSSSRGIFDVSNIMMDGDSNDDDERKPKATGYGRKRAPTAEAVAATTESSSRRPTRSDENQSPSKRNNKRQQTGVTVNTATTLKNDGIIDLTCSDDDNDDDNHRRSSVPQRQRHCEWPCAQCTFLNPHSIIVCNMCAAPKS